MKNRELFQRDPAVSKLLNDGVAAVREAASDKEIETLRYELEHFVCEGQYEDGLIRILESYLGNVSSTTQPAAWVSGFYGSGKSHLLKMFRHLWVDTRFADGATARGLARLPQEVQDLLRELDTLGKRSGGLHAASGTLPSGGGESVRLAVLSIVLASKGLPEALPQAQFCMWLQKNGIFDRVKAAVEAAGKDFFGELHDLYVSPVLAKAVLDADPDFAADLKQARAALRAQFPVVEDISTNEFIRLVREVLSVDGQIPCTVIVLDEIQLFIGNDPGRSTDVQEVAEALCKQLDSRVLLIGAGQTALAGNVPLAPAPHRPVHHPGGTLRLRRGDGHPPRRAGEEGRQEEGHRRHAQRPRRRDRPPACRHAHRRLRGRPRHHRGRLPAAAGPPAVLGARAPRGGRARHGQPASHATQDRP